MSDQEYSQGFFEWAGQWGVFFMQAGILFCVIFALNEARKEFTGINKAEKQRECFLAYYAQEAAPVAEKTQKGSR